MIDIQTDSIVQSEGRSPSGVNHGSHENVRRTTELNHLRRVRRREPPVALAGDRYLYGFGCKPEGCREGGTFLAYDVHDERIFILLTEMGNVRLSVPPDPRGWPEALRGALAEFLPALAEAMGPPR